MEEEKRVFTFYNPVGGRWKHVEVSVCTRRNKKYQMHILHTHIVWSDWNRATIISFLDFLVLLWVSPALPISLICNAASSVFVRPSPHPSAVFSLVGVHFSSPFTCNRTQFHIWKSLGQTHIVTHLIVATLLACNAWKSFTYSVEFACTFIEQIASDCFFFFFLFHRNVWRYEVALKLEFNRRAEKRTSEWKQIILFENKMGIVWARCRRRWNL